MATEFDALSTTFYLKYATRTRTEDEIKWNIFRVERSEEKEKSSIQMENANPAESRPYKRHDICARSPSRSNMPNHQFVQRVLEK